MGEEILRVLRVLQAILEHRPQLVDELDRAVHLVEQAGLGIAPLLAPSFCEPVDEAMCVVAMGSTMQINAREATKTSLMALS